MKVSYPKLILISNCSNNSRRMRSTFRKARTTSRIASTIATSEFKRIFEPSSSSRRRSSTSKGDRKKSVTSRNSFNLNYLK